MKKKGRKPSKIFRSLFTFTLATNIGAGESEKTGGEFHLDLEGGWLLSFLTRIESLKRYDLVRFSVVGRTGCFDTVAAWVYIHLKWLVIEAQKGAHLIIPGELERARPVAFHFFRRCKKSATLETLKTYRLPAHSAL